MKYTSPICDRPSNMPGTAPPTKSAPVEIWATEAKITIGIEGGIMGPWTEEATVTAVENSSE